jgi:hypothetical protein
METQRLSGESARAYAAYECYREFGPERSQEKVSQKLAKSRQIISRWSAQYRWVNRAAEWDKEQERLREDARKAEIERIMSEGYAATHNRVKDLNKLARKQWKDLQKKELVWLPDVKSIGSGEFAERVDLIRYNAALSEQFRASLDDIAKEVGGRVKKIDGKLEITDPYSEAIKAARAIRNLDSGQ